jgi:hypothetical protein
MGRRLPPLKPAFRDPNWQLFKFQKPVIGTHVKISNEAHTCVVFAEWSEHWDGLFGEDFKFYGWAEFDDIRGHFTFDRSRPFIVSPEEWPEW